MQQSHLTDRIMSRHDASTDATMHDFELKAIGDSTANVNKQDLTVYEETRIKESNADC